MATMNIYSEETLNSPVDLSIFWDADACQDENAVRETCKWVYQYLSAHNNSASFKDIFENFQQSIKDCKPESCTDPDGFENQLDETMSMLVSDVIKYTEKLRVDFTTGETLEEMTLYIE